MSAVLAATAALCLAGLAVWDSLRTRARNGQLLLLLDVTEDAWRVAETQLAELKARIQPRGLGGRFASKPVVTGASSPHQEGFEP